MLSRPREALDKSQDPRYSPWRRSDWETIKEEVMYKALQAKFYQHKRLGQQLRDTGDRELIKHSPYDSYWGDGGNGTGKNRLGVLLMKLRDDMKRNLQIQAPLRPRLICPSPQPSHTGASTSKPSSVFLPCSMVECKQKQMDEGIAVQPSSRPGDNSSNNELNTTAPHPTNGYFPSDGPNSGSVFSNVGRDKVTHATTATLAVSPANPVSHSQLQGHHLSSTATPNDLIENAPQKSTQHTDQSENAPTDQNNLTGSIFEQTGKLFNSFYSYVVSSVIGDSPSQDVHPNPDPVQLAQSDVCGPLPKQEKHAQHPVEEKPHATVHQKPQQLMAPHDVWGPQCKQEKHALQEKPHATVHQKPQQLMAPHAQSDVRGPQRKQEKHALQEKTHATVHQKPQQLMAPHDVWGPQRKQEKHALQEKPHATVHQKPQQL
jgi:hypothetical protein